MITFNSSNPNYSNSKYIESHNIRVFPCAYRGYFNDGTLVFDPEAKATTESNFANTFHKLSTNKESYVVDWIPDSASNPLGEGTLKCVIGGYYIEIYNHKISDFFYADGEDQQAYYLYIKTGSVDLGDSVEPDTSETRTTEILKPFDTTLSEYYLDVKNTDNKYAFIGLLISQQIQNDATAELQPFLINYEYTKIGTITESNSYSGYYRVQNDTYIKIDGYNSAYDGEDAYERKISYEVNPIKLPVTALLDSGNGKYSIRLLGTIDTTTPSNNTTTTATGDYAVALGKSTEALGEASTALGNDTKASGKGSLTVGNTTAASGEGAAAVGNNTRASNTGTFTAGSSTSASGLNAVAMGDTTSAIGDQSLAFGSNVHADGENQVVFGKYNRTDLDQAFIIANGNSLSEEDLLAANKFTVDYNGNTKTLGTLEIKGSIKATGNSTNDLVLGTTTTSSSGSIKVYGTGTTEVFKVESSGNTSITGRTTITNAQNVTASSAALQVSGGVRVSKNLAVNGNTSLGGTLAVADGKHTSLGGALTVAGTTTINDTFKVIKTTELNGNTTINGELTVSGATTLPTISINGKATSSQTAETDIATTLTTKKYVDDKHTAALTQITNSITALDYSTPSAATTSTGKYIQSVTQTDGKIAVAERGFETSIVSTNNLNAPTAKAVSDFVTTTLNAALSSLWTTAYIKDSAAATTTKTLQNIILNTAYPVGSIYICYATVDLTTCPIQTSLGGTWAAIDAGTFLCAANSTAGSIYNRGYDKGGFEETQLAAHTHTISRNSNHDTSKNSTTIVSESSGEHKHSITLTARAHDASTDNGLRSGHVKDGGCHQWDFTYTTANSGSHTHDIDLNKLQLSTAGTDLSTTTGTNLPPYVAVYMWKRTA